MARQNGWRKMFAILALGGFILAAPSLANADIAGDIAAGKNAAVVAQAAVKSGMAPVEAALTAAQALVKANADSQLAVDMAVALAQENPKQAVEIVRAVQDIYPDRAQDIAAAAAKTICSDDQREKYSTVNKDDLLDVCAGLGLEAYEGPERHSPIHLDTPPFQDIRPASGV